MENFRFLDANRTKIELEEELYYFELYDPNLIFWWKICSLFLFCMKNIC